jgi:hypothetical protein
MAGKEITDSFVQVALHWLRRNRMNIDMSEEDNGAGSTVYFIRLRPWSNKRGSAVMYVGYADTADTAIRMAMKAALNEDLMELDYAYRPWRTANNGGAGKQGLTELPF